MGDDPLAVALRDDGRTVIFAVANNAVEVRDVLSGKTLKMLIGGALYNKFGNAEWVAGVTLSQDGRFAAAGMAAARRQRAGKCAMRSRKNQFSRWVHNPKKRTD